jgi:SH3-like domain-containing protein
VFRQKVIQEYCIFRLSDYQYLIAMNLFSLIKILIPAACLIFAFTGCNPSIEKSGDYQVVIDSISASFIPDRRMGIRDIKVRTGRDGTIILTGETTNPHIKGAIIKALSNNSNKLVDSIITLPDTLINKRYTGLVTLSVSNIRKLPDHRAELVSQAVLGTPVRILKNKSGWLLVQTPDHYLGWTESSSVKTMTESERAVWKRSDRVITIINTGLIYSSPSGSGITGDFVSGCILENEGEINGFTKVRLPDGREGCIPSNSVTDFNTWRRDVRCTGDNIVRSASTFTGLPYLWGGSSSKGFDCSGFSQTVYYLNGIILLRDASLQELHGMKVDISQGYGQLKPGDLLFFGTKENSKLHVTHVAVYIGDSEYIHSSGRVMITSFDSTRSNYSGSLVDLLLSAKRIIGADNDPGIGHINSHPWY